MTGSDESYDWVQSPPDADPNAGYDMQALQRNLEARVFAPGNTSGIKPTEFKVLIAPKETAEVSKGGVIMPDIVKDREKYAEIEGTIVALSPLAFSYASEAEWGEGAKPKVGDRIIIAKYSGVRVKGDDGKEYLLTNDKDICAIRA